MEACTLPLSPAHVFARLQRYVGMPYRLGEFDCADLAQLVQWEVFARRVSLPGARRRPAGAAGQRAMILAMREAVATRVAEPTTGGAALFTEANEQGFDEYHIGTVALHAGDVWVLHNSHALGGAHLHRLSDLARWGLRLEGWYAWK
jgi:hypothetical protein